MKIREDIEDEHIITDSDKKDYIHFGIRMMTSNSIEGLVGCSIRERDGKKEIIARVRGLKSMNSLLDKRNTDQYAVMISMFSDLYLLYMRMENYFLYPEDIYLDADHIFFDEKKESFLFICIPGSAEDQTFQQKLKCLAEELIEKIRPFSCDGNDFLNNIYNCTDDKEFDPEILNIHSFKNSQMNIAVSATEEQLRSRTGGVRIRLLSMNRSMCGDKDIMLNDKDLVTVGRDRTSDIIINCSTVSRKHCVILKKGANVYIKDLGSTNGTEIEKDPAEPGREYEISDRCHITIGGIRYRLRISDQRQTVKNAEN